MKKKNKTKTKKGNEENQILSNRSTENRKNEIGNKFFGGGGGGGWNMDPK